MDELSYNPPPPPPSPTHFHSSQCRRINNDYKPPSLPRMMKLLQDTAERERSSTASYWVTDRNECTRAQILSGEPPFKGHRLHNTWSFSRAPVSSRSLHLPLCPLMFLKTLNQHTCLYHALYSFTMHRCITVACELCLWGPCTSSATPHRVHLKILQHPRLINFKMHQHRVSFLLIVTQQVVKVGALSVFCCFFVWKLIPKTHKTLFWYCDK